MSLTICLCWTCYLNGITQYVAFRDRLAPFTWHSVSRAICVVACIRTPFLGVPHGWQLWGCSGDEEESGRPATLVFLCGHKHPHVVPSPSRGLTTIKRTKWLLCYRLPKAAKPKHLGPDSPGTENRLCTYYVPGTALSTPRPLCTQASAWPCAVHVTITQI